MERNDPRIPKVQKLDYGSVGPGQLQDHEVKNSLSKLDTVKSEAIILRGPDQLREPGLLTFGIAEIEHSCLRKAQISAGLSWSKNVTRHEAGILASHTICVFLCELRVPSSDEIQTIIQDAVEDGLNRYYNSWGVPYTKPKGRPEINFVKEK